MSFLKKSLGRSSGSKLKSASSTTSPPWATAADVEAERRERERETAREEAQRRQLLNVNRYAAGGGGAPAFTQMRKQEQSRVEKMQNQTFTRWVNLQLSNTGAEPLLDLVQGLASGENLLRLLAVLSGKSVVAAPSAGAHGQNLSNSKEVGSRKTGLGSVGSRFQSLGKVEQAFKFMKEEGIPLIGIGPQDISQGNLKLILGMMWSIIQHYRLVHLFNDEAEEETSSVASPTPISEKQQAQDVEVPKSENSNESNTKASAKKTDALPTSDAGQGGVKVSALQLGEATNKKGKETKIKKEKAAVKQDRQTAVETVPEAGSGKALAVDNHKAKQTSSQPARVTQHSVESSLLVWAQEKIASSSPKSDHQAQVRNVKEIFADGRTLPALVNAIHPGLVDVKALDVKKPIENNKLALKLATEKLGVPSLLDSEDLTSGADLDGLSLILYLSYLKQADTRKAEESEKVQQPATTITESKPEVAAQQEENKGKEAKPNAGPSITLQKAKTSKENGTAASRTSSPEEKQAESNDEPVVAEKEISPVTETISTSALETSSHTEKKDSTKDQTDDMEKANDDGNTALTRPEPERPPSGSQKAEKQDTSNVDHEASSPSAVAKVVEDKETTTDDSEAQDTKIDVNKTDQGTTAQRETTEKRQEPVATEANEKAKDDLASQKEEGPKAPPGIDAKEKDGEKSSATEEEPEERSREVSLTQTEPKALTEKVETAVETAEPEPVRRGETKTDVEAETAETDEGLTTETNTNKKIKKTKKTKKIKKAKKEKQQTDDQEKKKKKKKKKKKSSKIEDSSELPTTAVPEKKEVPVTKTEQNLPHSRLPGRNGSDLSHLAGEERSPFKKEAYQVAAIPERKPKKPVLPEAEDPVSAFWYS